MFSSFKNRVPPILPLLGPDSQLRRVDWLQELRDIDAKRDTFFKEQRPGFLIRPLSNRSIDIIAGRRYEMDYLRPVTASDSEIMYGAIMRTAIMHPRAHFFEHSYALMGTEIKDARYYGHLTACYIIDTATRILEGPNSVKTVPELAKNLFLYFQRLLSYKETALQTLGVDKELTSKILEVLAAQYVTESDYQNVLTDGFIKRYKSIITSYPKERAKQGIGMKTLPPPVREILEITFRDGLVATYGVKGEGILFGLNNGMKVLPSEISYGDGKIIYYGTTLDLSLPLSSLQQDLEQVGASATLKREELETLYVKKAAPLLKPFNTPFSSDQDPNILEMREALAVSDIYKTFGHKGAAEQVILLEDNLGGHLGGVALVFPAAPHEKRVNLFNEALELSEHGDQSKNGIALRSRYLLGYATYLHDYAVTLKDKITLDETIFLLRTSLELINRYKEVCKVRDEPKILLNVEMNLGGALGVKAGNTSLPHDVSKNLFEEAISLFNHAFIAFRYKDAKVNLDVTFERYGGYLIKYVSKHKKNSVDESIPLLKKSIEYSRKANTKNTKTNIALAEYGLGSLLMEKYHSSELIEKTSLYEEAKSLIERSSGTLALVESSLRKFVRKWTTKMMVARN